MNENPVMVVLYVGIAAYVLHMYWGDLRANQSSEVNSGGMPGATSAGVGTFAIGVVGALLILAAETFGEIAMGVADEQSELVWYLVFAIVAAGVVEEIIFRGFLVIDKKGKAALIGSCIGFSLLFAIIHPQLWSTEDGFHLTLTAKGFFSTGILFANSLWFYAVRFGPWNPRHSIFPCMLAHAASNLGVFGVKLAQGYIIF